jgi:hypothetical protein
MCALTRAFLATHGLLAIQGHIKTWNFYGEAISLVSIKTMNTKDELYKWDLTAGKKGTFGVIDAQLTEYAYMWKGRTDGAFTHVTYGQSSYPTNIQVGDNVTLIDPRPKIEYLYWGADADPIREAVFSQKLVRSTNLGGDWFYLAGKFGFGVKKTQLSDTQYSSTNPNTNNKYGTANISGTELYMPLYFETGVYVQAKTSQSQLVGALGVYYQNENGIFSFMKMNSTSNGQDWATLLPFQWGLVTRVTMQF